MKFLDTDPSIPSDILTINFVSPKDKVSVINSVSFICSTSPCSKDFWNKSVLSILLRKRKLFDVKNNKQKKVTLEIILHSCCSHCYKNVEICSCCSEDCFGLPIDKHKNLTDWVCEGCFGLPFVKHNRLYTRYACLKTNRTIHNSQIYQHVCWIPTHKLCYCGVFSVSFCLIFLNAFFYSVLDNSNWINNLLQCLFLFE